MASPTNNTKQLANVGSTDKKRPSNEIQLASVPTIVPVHKKPKKEVIEEDTYLEAVEEIIQRDFYPDLPKLRNQLEWLEAEEKGDIVKMREIQMKLRKSSRRRTNLGTPATFETPASFTPASFTPANFTPAPGATSNPLAPREQPKEPTKRESLDLYLSKHTSEDNAAFDQILDKQNQQRKEQFHFLHSGEDESKLLITGPEVSAGAIQTWKYVARNQLMYNPDGSAYTQKEEKLAYAGPPKEITHSGTRLHGPVFNSEASKGGRTEPSALDEKTLLLQRRAMKNSKIDLDEVRGFKNSVLESPKVGGYGFMMTPSPAPGVEASPFTTWGDIEGTPLLLDLDTPINLNSGSGPAFKMPEPVRREELALKLVEKAKEKNKKLTSTGSKTPLRQVPSSPLRADLQLRASYSTPVAKKAGATPSPRSRMGVATPSPSHTAKRQSKS